jgi:hypothetical protein
VPLRPAVRAEQGVIKMVNTIRLFIIESVDPMDILQNRSEGRALGEICRIIGHEVAVLNAYSKSDFRNLCNYISSISTKHDDKKRKRVPLCIHLVAHGNNHGLGFGKDFLRWKDILQAMKPVYTEMAEYDGEVILVISACGAGQQNLTEEFEDQWNEDKEFLPPKYVFVTKDEDVSWGDALVSWAMFYHQLPRAALDEKVSVQAILDKIRVSETGNLKYFRWDRDREEYLQYSGKTTSPNKTVHRIAGKSGSR